MRKVTVLKDVALITCIVQKGVGERIVDAARDAGAQGATVHFARGTGVRERLGLVGVALEVEKEVIDIVVSSDQVDRIFEKMYLAGNLDALGRGIMYITPVEKVATYIPPEVLERLSASSNTDKERGE